MWVTFASVVEVVYLVSVAAWVLLSKRSPAGTLAWILCLAFMPVVGIPFYWAFGPRRFRRRRMRHQRARLKVRTQHPRDPHETSALKAAVDRLEPRFRQLADLATVASDAPPTLCTGVRILTSGRDCFDALFAAIEAAQHHVHVLYYIFSPDEAGRRLRDALIARARAGVQVRVLVDAVGSSEATDAFFTPMAEAGVDVARFNPPRLFRVRPLANFRNHRKLVICDGCVGFTGGVNVGDEYVTGRGSAPPWRDTHVRLEGPAVRWMQLVFLEDWHFAVGASPSGSHYFPSAAVPGTHLVQLVASGPDTESHAIHRVFFAAINAARDRVLLTTPYFVPDEALFEALTTAALRGVKVRVLVPRQNDSRVVAAAARSYYEEMLTAGVRVYEYLPTMLHAKTLVVDRSFSLVGTANFDNRSTRLNFEVAALLYGEEHARTLGEVFDEDLGQSEEVRPGTLHRRPLAGRVFEATARLLSPLL